MSKLFKHFLVVVCSVALLSSSVHASEATAATQTNQRSELAHSEETSKDNSQSAADLHKSEQLTKEEKSDGCKDPDCGCCRPRVGKCEEEKCCTEKKWCCLGQAPREKGPCSLTNLEWRLCRHSRLYIGPQFYHMHFSIDQLPSYNGWLGGGEGGYEYLKEKGLYTRVDGYMNVGKLDNSTNSNTRKVHDNAISLVFGYNFLLGQCEAIRFTPYIGYGLSYISNRLTTDNSSLKFVYLKYYIPVGGQLIYSFLEDFQLGLTFEWMPFVDRTVNRSSNPGTRWTLDSTNGFQVELPFRWYFADVCWGTWDLSLMPFWRRNADGATSATTTSGTQLELPAQVYNNWGAKFYLGYSF